MGGGQLGRGRVDATSPLLVPLPPGCEVDAIVAGGQSSALMLRRSPKTMGQRRGDEPGVLRARTPAKIDLITVKALSANEDWSALASLVNAVFSSPALSNASFADADGRLDGVTLEQTYVLLLKTFGAAPAVLSALRDASRRMLAAVDEALTHSATEPPPALRSQSSAHVAGAGAPVGTLASPPAGAVAGARRSPTAHLLTPLAIALCNPMLSHASEAAQLHHVARIVDERLSGAQRNHLAEILSDLPAEVLAARVVRPVRDALERSCKAQTAGTGDRSELSTAIVFLTRLLGLARDANMHAHEEAVGDAHAHAHVTTAAGVGGRAGNVTGGGEGGATGAGGGACAGGGIAPSEFYSPFLSERLDLQADYLTWLQQGPSERGQHGARWSFCSESWILNAQAKAKLLRIEAGIQMQQQAQTQVAMLRAGVRRVADPDDLALPPKSRRRTNVSAGSGMNAARGAREAGALEQPPPPDPASPYLILRVRRSCLVDDTLNALAQQSRKSLLRPLRVVFEGEPAVDEGGVRKELFQCLIEQLFNVDFGMFEWHAEPRAFWFSRASTDAAEFFLIGLVIGLAIYNGLTLDLHFPPLLWQRLMNEPVGFAQLFQVYPDLARGLASLLAFDGDVESTFLADFSVTADSLGAMHTTELVPGGAAIPVTNANRDDYVQRYAAYLLVDSVQEQFDAFQQGFLLLCDGAAFSFLTPVELEELVCGTPHLDFHALEAGTQYAGGFHPNHPTVRLFWEVVHSMTIEDKRALLAFATGCDKSPVGGLGKLQFVLQQAGPDAMDLPTAHTCFNVLAMPAYTSRAKLRDRLTIAIHNATGFGLQ